MNGWVLLHKKIWNSVVTSSPAALAVWVWLLTHADNNGVVVCGRNQIAKDTGVKAPTVQYWTSRFLRENYQLAIIETNNKYSKFQICKWEEYQRPTISTSSRRLSKNYQPTITNKEINNKEKELKTIPYPSLQEGLREIQEGVKKLNTENAYEFHDGMVELLNKLGYKCQREFPVPGRGDGYGGKVDIVATKEGMRLALELDRASPRQKSVYKLKQVPDAFRVVILREGSTTDPPDGIDAVIGAQTKQKKHLSGDLSHLM